MHLLVHGSFFCLENVGDCRCHYICKCVKYWNPVVTIHNAYTHSCYNLLKGLRGAAIVTWASNDKYKLFLYDFGYVWINQSVADTKLFLEIRKVRLRDCVTQKKYKIASTKFRRTNRKLSFERFRGTLPISKRVWMFLRI